MGSQVLRPDSDLQWVRTDAAELERKLQVGDGMGFPGDPRLFLSQGIVAAAKRTQHPVTGAWLNKGDVLARRWEVWRTCEDGIDRKIGTWRMEEFDRILLDMSGMRLDAPGHVDATESIDAANAKIDKDNSDDIKEHMGEAMEHMAKLHHDTTEPKNVFRGMPGLRDEPQLGISPAESKSDAV